MPALPTSTIPQDATTVLPREETVTVTIVAQPIYEDGNEMSGGVIAGIVISSIFGFILICWIIWVLTRRRWSDDEYYYHEERSPHGHHHHHHHHGRGRSRSTTIRVRAPSQVYMSEARRSSHGSRSPHVHV